ncbi:MAG: anti-sigma factor family protein [Planctomycetota bacterium]
MTYPFPDDLISAYLDGELNADERARVEEQLRDDAELRRLFEELRGMRAMLQSMPVASPSEDFSERVLRQAERRMLLGEDEANPAGLASRRDSPDKVEPASSEKRSSWKRHWRFIVPLISTVAAVLLVALLLIDDPFSLRAKRRVAQGVDGEVTDRPAAATERGQAAEDNAKFAEAMAETQDRDSASDLSGTVDEADEALEEELSSRGAGDMSREPMSREPSDATGDDRAAEGGIRQGSRKMENAPRRQSSSLSDDYGSAPGGTSPQQQARGHESGGKESVDKMESSPERSNAPAPREGPGLKGDELRAGQEPLKHREPAAPRSRGRPSAMESRQPAPATPRSGRGFGDGMRREKPKDSPASPELAAQPPMAEEPSASASRMDASDEDDNSRATAAQKLANQLRANESLWVQVSLSHDAKRELSKWKQNGKDKDKDKDKDKVRPWGAVARRLLGTPDDAPVELKVSAVQGGKLLAEDQESPALRLSPAGQVILVEGTKENLRGSLERLASRSDIRINQVFTSSAGELGRVRAGVEPPGEKPSAQQESEEATASGEQAKRSKKKIEDQPTLEKERNEFSPAASAPETDRKQAMPRPKGLDALGHGDARPIEPDASSVDQATGEARKKPLGRPPAADSKAPATETVLHFVFRRTSEAPNAVGRELPSGPTPVVEPPEDTRDDQQ